MTISTIRDLLDHSFSVWRDNVAQTYYAHDRWITRTFGDLYESVARVAQTIELLDLTPCKDRVAVMLENSPEWTDIYLAHAATGIQVVPMDPKLQAKEILHILNDSQSKVLYLSTKLKSLIEGIKDQLPNLKHVILVSHDEVPSKTLTESVFQCFDQLISTIPEKAHAWFDAHRPKDANDIASILYTSGTTGQPKGAILTHGNFCANAESTLHEVPVKPVDSFMVVLPLFHAYSFMANFIYPLHTGAKVYFMRSLRTVADDMRQLKPTILMTVPLMAEKIYAKIGPQIEASKMAQFLIKVGLKSVICKKVVKNMGGKLRFFGIGGAPLPRNVFDGFRKFGFPIIEGYGITECSPGIVYGRIEEYHPGYVGRLIYGMEKRIVNPDEHGVGELWVKGPNVSPGYLNNPEATAEAFVDGWFKTGDLCYEGPKGLIAIRGRKKAMIVNREGKNIYAEEVEQSIAKDPRVGDVIVLAYTSENENGERIGCIVAPNPEWEEKDPAIIKQTLKEIVIKQCAELATYKHPRKVIVSFDPLERTSTMKVKRGVYANSLDEKTK